MGNIKKYYSLTFILSLLFFFKSNLYLCIAGQLTDLFLNLSLYVNIPRTIFLLKTTTLIELTEKDNEETSY